MKKGILVFLSPKRREAARQERHHRVARGNGLSKDLTTPQSESMRMGINDAEDMWVRWKKFDASRRFVFGDHASE